MLFGFLDRFKIKNLKKYVTFTFYEIDWAPYSALPRARCGPANVPVHVYSKN